MNIQIYCMCKASCALGNFAYDLTTVYVNIAKIVTVNTCMHPQIMLQDLLYITYNTSPLHVIVECHSQRCIGSTLQDKLNSRVPTINDTRSNKSIIAFYCT